MHGQVNYYKYLESEKWKKKRDARLRIDRFTCQTCCATDRLEVHHKHYESLGREDVDDDLITLCRECHEAITSVMRGRRYGERCHTTQDHQRMTPVVENRRGENVQQDYVSDSRRVTPDFAQWATGRPSK